MPEKQFDGGEATACTSLHLLLFCWAISAQSALAAGAFCDNAAEFAARQTGVPVSVLRTLTRVETGRKHMGKVEPWPWAINLAGKGFWFETADEAQAFTFRQIKSGARNFDVGCFQINYRWHGHAFSSIDDMFDPRANALYAAHFLNDLFGEFGNWEAAAGAYHSRTKRFADRYKARFNAIRAGLDADADGFTGHPTRHSGRGALISSGPGGQRAPGSLVALSTRSGSAFLTLD